MRPLRDREGRKGSYLVLGIALGLAVGAGVGTAIGRPILAAVGIVVGVLVAVVLDRRRREEPLPPSDSAEN